MVGTPGGGPCGDEATGQATVAEDSGVAEEHEPFSWAGVAPWKTVETDPNDEEGHWLDDYPEPAEPSLPVAAARRSKVTLSPKQDLWMWGILSDAIRDGVRLSEGDWGDPAPDPRPAASGPDPRVVARPCIAFPTSGRSRPGSGTSD